MALNEAQKKERSEYLEQNLRITECSQRKPYVFISYASDNWETVFKTAVVPMQRQYGLCVYADKAFDKVNDKWIVPMLRNIRGSDAVIAFVSQSYIESYACFLELLTAVNNKKQVIFVSLEQNLRLGDTTDQPNIERGVKNEILNQGANIATNTNNTSNDIMRAMKSAYTSISTLLEQDALSKYDISDAFINFFRDSSINRKTINDLNAVRGTIFSVSREVFDKSLVVESVNRAKPAPQPSPSSIPAPALQEAQKPQAVPVQKSELITSPVEQKPSPVERQDAPPVKSPVKQNIPAPEQETIPPIKPHLNPWAQTANPPTEQVSAPSGQQPVPASGDTEAVSAQSAKDIRGSKKKILLIAAACFLVFIVACSAFSYVSPKNVENKPYSVNDRSGSYTGIWKGGQPEGEGSFRWENRDLYTGEWLNGLPNGQGTLKSANGDIYTGGFRNGQYNSQGTMTYANGDVYTGGFWNGQYNGQGTMTYANGDVYEGKWSKGKPNGQGTCTYATGDIYEGEWSNGYPNGKGTFTYVDGYVYEGEWLNGTPNGKGTITYTTGEVYEVEWKDGPLGLAGKWVANTPKPWNTGGG